MAAEQGGKWVQRILVMLDIRHLKSLQNRKPYLTAIQQSVDKLLRSCDPTSLWAFKLFDSSLSSYRSRSVIEQNVGKWATHIRFDSVQQIQMFISALKSLANNADSLQPSAHSRVESVAQSMQELIHDYVWEPVIIDNNTPGKQDVFSKHKNSNLVVLFSSVPWTRTGFAEFIKDEKSCTDLSSLSDEQLMELFSLKFKSVIESFGSRDIHFCWIDIPPLVSQMRDSPNEISQGKIFEVFRKMGWSFTAVDVVILASRFVPFSLIWPTIAYPMVSSPQCSALAEVDLDLEDIDGKALVCRTCEVQWTELTQAKTLNLPRDESSYNGRMNFSLLIQKHLDKNCSAGHMKIHVVLPFPMEKFLNLRNIISSCVLLSGISGKKKYKTDHSHEQNELEGNVAKDKMDSDLLGDEVLMRLQQKSGEFRCGKPAWQLLLVFLARKNFLALVNISDKNNHSFGAVLEPLTVHTALLHVLGTKFSFTSNIPPKDSSFGGDCSELVCTKALETEPQAEPNLKGQVIDNSRNACERSEMEVNLVYNQSLPCERELAPASMCFGGPKESVPSGPLSNKNSREHKSSKMGLDLQCNTWDSLYSAIVGGTCKTVSDVILATKLEDRYFKGSCRQSKILRFLSRWMKKISKKLDAGQAFDNLFNQAVLNSRPTEKNKATVDPVFKKTPQPLAECEQFCPRSTAFPSLSNASLSTEVGDCDSETVELDNEKAEKAFAESLDEKMQHGLSSKEVDLRALAQRLTDVVIQHVEVQLEAEHCSSTNVAKASILTKRSICHEVMKLILKKPKELAVKYKDCPLPLSSQLGNSDFASLYTSEDKVREHELQVLFRMEILASKIAGSIEEQTKNKLIKEICKLLENIQFNLPGGIFGGENLNEFANRVIASRYINRLDMVIRKAYKDMEFYAYDDSGDIFNSLSNEDKDADMQKNEHDAETSSQNDFMATNGGEGRNAGQIGQSYCQMSAMYDDQHSLKLPQDEKVSRKHSEKYPGDDYERRLKKAEANRERARRFAHFTSRARDLQRVWAPKQASHMIRKQSNSQINHSKKKHSKADKGDVVYETPMRSSKLRKYKDGKAVVVGRKETKTTIDFVDETPYPRTNYRLKATSDIVHETPYPISKVQNHMSAVRTVVVVNPDSRTAPDHVTSGTDSKLGLISRALFENEKSF
ncbi:hypothetical protein SUGI_0604090 [Cryptomeria japonica]|uniref:uncharacterized protein LOC131077632 n=1 Tax=Cryptomeria japonica TaxID=3369 RepID=UPI002414A2E5|nr:uncharacterized protein LOC131077632 [Cryptomeria japonica]GLJ30517.1 hypothetical protein SUGI_0604090 [Cryptomeria japonica]